MSVLLTAADASLPPPAESAGAGGAAGSSAEGLALLSSLASALGIQLLAHTLGPPDEGDTGGATGGARSGQVISRGQVSSCLLC
jgi:hypothetical protein